MKLNHCCVVWHDLPQHQARRKKQKRRHMPLLKKDIPQRKENQQSESGRFDRALSHTTKAIDTQTCDCCM